MRNHARKIGLRTRRDAHSTERFVSSFSPRWRRRALPVLALWGLALIAYCDCFRAGLAFDNAAAIREDSRIQAVTLQNIHLVLTQEYWYNRTVTGLYRPVTTLSFLVNYTLLGNGPRPAGYHWVNFALHALNIMLVYFLGLALFREGEARERLALALAAIWAVHPVLTESVTNIVGRADLLAGMGVLTALHCYIRSTTATGWNKLAWLSFFGVAAAFGLFSKESAVVVLPAMLLYDATYGAHRSWRARASGYLVLALSFLLFFGVRAQVLARLPSAQIPFGDNPLVGADFWTARVTAVKVIGKYLWLLVWPKDLSCDYSYNQVPLFAWRWNTWEDWKTAIAVSVCLALAAVAVVCYRRSRPLFFFIAFFFIALAPTSNLLIFIGTIMAERFLYLPSIGFAGCLVLAIYAVYRRALAVWPGGQMFAAGALALVAVALAARTYLRNAEWFDDRSLWTSAIEASPLSYKTHTAADWVFLNLPGDAGLDAAVREADRSLAILDPLPDRRNVSAAYVNAGVTYRMKGDAITAERRGYWYGKSLEALLRGQRIDTVYAQELRQPNQESDKTPPPSGWTSLYLELGRTYLRLSQPRKALDALEAGRLLRPDAEFFEEMAAAYRAMGDSHQAAITLMEGLTVDPGNTQYAFELVKLYQKTEPESCAIRDENGSVSVNAACPLVHSQLCTASRNVAQVYRQRGQDAAAAATIRSAIDDLGCPAKLFQ